MQQLRSGARSAVVWKPLVRSNTEPKLISRLERSSLERTSADGIVLAPKHGCRSLVGMWINNIRRLLCFWACATLPAVAAASPKPVVLTAAENGSTVYLRQAGILIVRLPSNGTTGYKWAPARVPDQLRLRADNYIAADRLQKKPVVAGAGGVQELWFSTRKPGLAVLVLEYRPGWGGKRADTYRIRVKVDGK